MNQLHRSTGIKVKDAIVKSLAAGMDIILYVGLPDKPENVVNLVVKALEAKELKQSEIENKVLRILLLKRDLH
jgi:beta-glucosidase-like glycosyl hydrolase